MREKGETSGTDLRQHFPRLLFLGRPFIPFIETSLKKYQLPPELIELELTESVFFSTLRIRDRIHQPAARNGDAVIHR
jgi:EAL domain-containing protein (putative c-di-GMP-specific phosphodiesterase class I)